ncbi:uncharacterized protein CIMG_09114 [Coccidioides immitis RS]|uniref:BTB domain-containing protein n=1 Tax=Coccidioides immitis (strain RS) TaxID=246410 RepID=J3K1N1_COCIM|nr:uncharacterized protein CIMG_09114 [Coccidioides immitis RS]EAS27910.3 hypothetical protein CIMG_09114 [Coccidioides immitis RS]
MSSMEKKCYAVDPDGDVVLLVRQQETPFAAWEGGASNPSKVEGSNSPYPPLQRKPSILKGDKKGTEHKKGRKSADFIKEPVSAEGPMAVHDPEPIEPNSHADQNQASQPSTPAKSTPWKSANNSTDSSQSENLATQDEYSWFKVSPRHLMLASPHFKETLTEGGRKAHILDSDGCITIREDGRDPDAMLLLMNVIHGRTRMVPQEITLEMLAKVAVLVDVYQCSEVVAVFSDIWIQRLTVPFPNTYSRDLILWIWVAWVFRKPEEFQLATQIALCQTPGPLPTLGLPIPQKVIGKESEVLRILWVLIGRLDTIDEQRKDSIDQIVEHLHGLRQDFLEQQESCSFECSSMLFGALTIEMHRRNLLPRTASPFPGASFAKVVQSVRLIRSPTWCPVAGWVSFNSTCRAHGCILSKFIDPVIEGLEHDLAGLELNDIE